MSVFFWYLEAAQGFTGSTARVNPRTGFYAFTPTFDAVDRDRVMDGPQWKAGNPIGEVVLWVLNTTKGSYVCDVGMGFDYKLLDHLTTNSQAKIEAGVFDCLNYLVRDGYITKLKSSATVFRNKDRSAACSCDVEFYDPRSNSNVRVKGNS